LDYLRYKSVKNSLSSILLSEIETKSVLIVPIVIKPGLAPKAKKKEGGGGVENKFTSGKFEANRQEFSKSVKRIKQIGLKLVLFPRRTVRSIRTITTRERQQAGHAICRGMNKQNI
jgi:hypothetical protein